LRPAASGGLIALVWLPDEAITHDGPGTAAGPGAPGPAMTVPASVAEAMARPVTEGAVAAPGPRRGSDFWSTGGTSSPLPGFRTVPRPADETGSLPGQTGPRPIVPPGEEPLTEPGDEEPADNAAAEPFVVGLPPVFGAHDDEAGDLPGGEADYRSGFRADDTADGRDSGVWDSVVATPTVEHFTTVNRLPIFEAVESDWFRQSGQAAIRFSREEEASPGWTSPADEGWRAAEVVHAPSSGGVTPAGLPKRVPRANLVPGAVAGAEAGASSATPARSAAATRDRFSSFQQGSRRGRAAADEEEAGGGGDELE
jgi:hypothetical protein